jgi:hypothetical protein
VEGEAERFGTIQQQELIARGGGAEGGERTPAVVRVWNDVQILLLFGVEIEILKLFS